MWGFQMDISPNTQLQRSDISNLLSQKTSQTEQEIDALKASCSLALSLLDATDLAIIATNLEGEILFFNRRAEQVFDYPEAQVLGTAFKHLLIPNAQKNVASMIQNAQQGKPWRGEIVFRPLDFTPFTTHIHCNPLRNDNGNVVGMVGICSDFIQLDTDNHQIWEQNRLLNAFHQIGLKVVSTLDQDEILDHLAEQVMDAGMFRSLTIALVNEEENSLVVARNIWRDLPLEKPNIQYRLDDATNHACLAAQRKETQVFGFIGDHPLGDSTPLKLRNKMAFFIPVKQKEKVVAVLATACAVENHEEIQHRIEVMRPLLDQVAIALEKAQLYKSIQLSIVEREEAEKTLRESEERYRLLVENAPICIHEIDLQGRLISMNRTGLKMMHAENESAVCGLLYLDVIAEEDRDRIAKLLDEACQGHPSHFQFKTKSKDNPLLFASCFIPIKDGNGHVIKLMGVTQNITERNRMEEELRRVQNLDALGILAGGIAHDFNNVLTGVIGNLSLLEISVDKNSDVYEFVKEAQKAANKTKGLTQQLMTFSKGGLPVKENASLAELIVETSTLCLSGSNTKPQYHLPSDLHWVEIDKSQIGQVIQNLVINADQAMPEGGILNISANNVVLEANNLMGILAGKYVKVLIEDQGIGIPPNVLRKIFDPYFTTKEAGHGLGLAISYSIVNKHDGYITADSSPGVGSTFEFYLPASKKETISSTQKIPTLTHGTGRVLVMDDDKTVRRSLNSMLNMLGYANDEVENGEEALTAYQAALQKGQPYDVVIMDLTIPGGMGG